jgi:protein required for attachment to host cells
MTVPIQWIIVADSVNARIFARANKNSSLQEVENLTHPSGRMKAGELESDKPGRSFDSRGQGRHSMETEHSRKDKESIVFVEQISDYLSTHQNDYDELIIISPPRFLGMLRKHIEKILSRKIIQEIDKDMVKLSPNEIQSHI